jgi:hypothetical protein
VVAIATAVVAMVMLRQVPTGAQPESLEPEGGDLARSLGAGS